MARTAQIRSGEVLYFVDYEKIGRLLEEAAQAFLRRFSTQTALSPELERYIECADKKVLKGADMPDIYYERCDDIIAAWAEHWLQWHGKAYLSTNWFVDELKDKILRKTLAREWASSRNRRWRRKIVQEALRRRQQKEQQGG